MNVIFERKIHFNNLFMNIYVLIEIKILKKIYELIFNYN